LVTIRLTDSVRLRVYAKTNRRIRLEVLHNVAHASSRVLRGGHTTERPEMIYHWLHRISIDAAQRANEVLTNIRHELNTAYEQRPIYHLLSEVAEVVEDEAAFDLVLSMLVNNARIVLGERDPMRPYVQELMRRDVLVRTRNYQQVYGLHPQYQSASSELRGARRR
jgi:hypothetical protein